MPREKKSVRSAPICKLILLRGINNSVSISILMKGITWSRDSHGLFDYESRHLTKRTLKAEKPMMMMRSSNELQLIPYDADTSFQKQINDNKNLPEDRALLKIVNRDDTFYLESATQMHHPEDLAELAKNTDE